MSNQTINYIFNLSGNFNNVIAEMMAAMFGGKGK